MKTGPYCNYCQVVLFIRFSNYANSGSHFSSFHFRSIEAAWNLGFVCTAQCLPYPPRFPNRNTVRLAFLADMSFSSISFFFSFLFSGDMKPPALIRFSQRGCLAGNKERRRRNPQENGEEIKQAEKSFFTEGPAEKFSWLQTKVLQTKLYFWGLGLLLFCWVARKHSWRSLTQFDLGFSVAIEESSYPVDPKSVSLLWAVLVMWLSHF